jgi:hypothetical protein
MGLVSKQPEDDEEQENDERHVLITGFGALDGAGPEEARFDLTSWSDPARAALDERLHLLEAPHGWDDATLVVEATNASWMERVIEQVQEERTVALDADADQIAYDLAEWDDQNRSLLLNGLQDQGIAHQIEDDELVVQETDEARVDELIDAILEPDASAAPGGEARAELMGELFVAADELTHDPRDASAAGAIRTGTAEVTEHAPPYGVETPWWHGIGTRCESLVRLLDSPSVDDDVVVEQATALRDALRPYV